MKFFLSKSLEPTYNLAVEEYFFLNKSSEYFMLWQNKNTIVIGKNQNTIEEINIDYINKNNINVVRRITGGGAVFQDLGNVNFSFIVNKDNDLDTSMRAFCNYIIGFLDSLGVKAEISGRNDMTIDGMKFSGNSQSFKGGRVLHHGTILFNSDLSILSKCLLVSENKIKSKGIKSVRSRVTNIYDHLDKKINVNEFIEYLLKYMNKLEKLDEVFLKDSDLKSIKELEEKYKSWDWNYGLSPRYTIEKEKWFKDCGTIKAIIDVKDGIIKDIRFYGDFIGGLDVTLLSKILIGTSLNRDILSNKIDKLNISDYFFNITKEGFLKLIT